jgi:hypothetical protein
MGSLQLLCDFLMEKWEANDCAKINGKEKKKNKKEKKHKHANSYLEPRVIC